MHNLTYNLLSLIHLANDVLVHGPLDSFSAFGFESHLGKIKRLLRGTNLPLAQLKRRLSEIDHIESLGISRKTTNNKNCKRHLDDLNVDKLSDRFCLKNDGTVFEIFEINETNVIGSKIKLGLDRNNQKIELYELPIAASSLNIIVISNHAGQRRTWPIEYFKDFCKCVVFPLNSYHRVAMPLLHSMY